MSEADNREAALTCVVITEAVLLVAGVRGIDALFLPGVMMFAYATVRYGFASSEAVAISRAK